MAAAVLAIRNRKRKGGDDDDGFDMDDVIPANTCSGSRLPGQDTVKRLYLHPAVQGGVAAMIVINFFCTLLEKEIDPFDFQSQQFPLVWQAIDHFFTWCFVAELLMNMWGHWLCEFYRSGCARAPRNAAG